MRDPIVVLGGGPCGLSCAWELATQGWDVVVLERETHPGGLCATNNFGEYRFDLGGHRFLSHNEDLTRRVLDLMGDDMLIPERKSVVMHSGKRFSYPLSTPNLIKNLGLGLNLRALMGYAAELIRRRIAPRNESHFEGWVTARFGRPLYDRFFGPYTEKLWGIPPKPDLIRLGSATHFPPESRGCGPSTRGTARHAYPDVCPPLLLPASRNGAVV